MHQATCRLLAAADALYARSMSGIAALPGDCRPGILAARWLYAEIGHVVARRGEARALERAVVARPRQLALVVGALARAPFLKTPLDESPPLPEVAFLVEAAKRRGAELDLPPQTVEDRSPGSSTCSSAWNGRTENAATSRVEADRGVDTHHSRR